MNFIPNIVSKTMTFQVIFYVRAPMQNGRGGYPPHPTAAGGETWEARL